MGGMMTLQDVARLAGVSLTTASLCLNGKARRYKIAESTRERVVAVARAHRFSPNLHAQAIAGQRTYLVGVAMADAIDRSFWLDILAGIEETLAAAQYHLILAVSHCDRRQEIAALEFMRGKGVDGFMVAPVMAGRGGNFAHLRRLAADRPTVTMTLPVTGIAGVHNDERMGGRMAADALLRLGHRRIAYLGPLDPPYLRGRAFLARCVACGVQAQAFPEAATFMARRRDVTAAFCFSDYVAMDLYAAAAQAGMAIPDELSVIGYDNMPFAALLRPRLATVNQHKKALGVAAASLLLEALAEPASRPRQIRLPTTLAEGDSIGPPPRRFPRPEKHARSEP